MNACYKNGKLSASLRQVIITCLPKDYKDIKYIKNWHSISLLSVIYKMTSTAIANRLKPYLSNVILKNQTGFIRLDILVKIPVLCMIYLVTLKKNKSQAF